MGMDSSSLVPEAVMAIVCVGVNLAKNEGPRTTERGMLRC